VQAWRLLGKDEAHLSLHVAEYDGNGGVDQRKIHGAPMSRAGSDGGGTFQLGLLRAAWDSASQGKAAALVIVGARVPPVTA